MRDHLAFAIKFSASVCLCGLLLLSPGCGGSKDPSKIGSQYDRLFSSADPETKACWDTAMAAMKTNGYAVTIQSIRKMMESGKLTPEQTQAARQTATATSDKMYDAANTGDPAAKQAIDDLRKATGR